MASYPLLFFPQVHPSVRGPESPVVAGQVQLLEEVETVIVPVLFELLTPALEGEMDGVQGSAETQLDSRTK